jgi:hypothetical protein
LTDVTEREVFVRDGSGGMSLVAELDKAEKWLQRIVIIIEPLNKEFLPPRRISAKSNIGDGPNDAGDGVQGPSREFSRGIHAMKQSESAASFGTESIEPQVRNFPL